MDGLFWILLWAGAIALVGVYLYTRSASNAKWKNPIKARRDSEEGDDAVGGYESRYVDDEEFEISPVRVNGQTETPVPHTAGGQAEGQAVDARPAEVPAPEPEIPDRIVQLFVQAPEASISGGDIRAAAVSEGMILGPDGFFEKKAREGGVIFRVANMMKPGTFSVAQFGSIMTPGLVLFMVLPNPAEGGGTAAWDEMMSCGRRLCSKFNAQLLDEQRSVLHDQTARYIRDTIVEYDAKHRVTADSE